MTPLGSRLSNERLLAAFGRFEIDLALRLVNLLGVPGGTSASNEPEIVTEPSRLLNRLLVKAKFVAAHRPRVRAVLREQQGLELHGAQQRLVAGVVHGQQQLALLGF